MRRLGVVIANHNYERYVGAAIDSALALRWDDVEVVVVDDGSTDGSVAVVERYAPRIKILLPENATQGVAANRGFAFTTGDVDVFLDTGTPIGSPSPTTDLCRRLRTSGGGLRRPPPIRHRPDRAMPTRGGSSTASSQSATGSVTRRIQPAWPPRRSSATSSPSPASSSATAGTGRTTATCFATPVAFPVRSVERGPDGASRNEHAVVRPARSTSVRCYAAANCCSYASRHVAWPPARGRCREMARPGCSSTRCGPPLQVGPEPLSRRVLISAWCVVTLLAPGRLLRSLLDARYGGIR